MAATSIVAVGVSGCTGGSDEEAADEPADGGDDAEDTDDSDEDPGPTAPTLSLTIELDEDNQLVFLHQAGDSLNWGDVTVLVDGDVSSADEEIAGGDISEGTHEAGTSVEYDVELDGGSGTVEVRVRHDPSESVISQEEIRFEE